MLVSATPLQADADMVVVRTAAPRVVRTVVPRQAVVQEVHQVQLGFQRHPLPVPMPPAHGIFRFRANMEVFDNILEQQMGGMALDNRAGGAIAPAGVAIAPAGVVRLRERIRLRELHTMFNSNDGLL